MVFCFLVVLPAGCGLVDSLPSRDARCDLRPAKDQCTDLREYKGPSFITFQGVCNTLTAAIGGGTYAEDARCDMTGVVAGCRTHNGDGSEQTNWYYSGEKYKTEADVKEECAAGQDVQAPEP
jgi:hypothetical protein